MKINKVNKIIILCLIVLSFAIAGVGLMMLSDIIPIHFGVDGKPDQFGSKYFILIFPGVITLCGLSMLLVCKYANVSENYKKYLLLIGSLTTAMFVAVLTVFLVYGITYTEEMPAFDVTKIVMLTFGLVMIVMSNFMPKIEKNNTLGIKTSWSLYNEVTWQKTHRFAGFVGVLCGLILLISGMLFEEMVNIIIMVSTIGVYAISSTVASYFYYKEEKAKEIE